MNTISMFTLPSLMFPVLHPLIHYMKHRKIYLLYLNDEFPV